MPSQESYKRVESVWNARQPQFLATYAHYVFATTDDFLEFIVHAVAISESTAVQKYIFDLSQEKPLRDSVWPPPCLRCFRARLFEQPGTRA